MANRELNMQSSSQAYSASSSAPLPAGGKKLLTTRACIHSALGDALQTWEHSQKHLEKGGPELFIQKGG